MSELTKLTAARFERLCDENISWPSTLRAEILRRLERLEQCEALCKYAQHHPKCAFLSSATRFCTCGYDAARAAVEETK